MSDFYVYGHFDEDGNCCYIGKGRLIRAWRFSQRSKRWFDKFKDRKPTVVIFEQNLTEEKAYIKEIEYISKALNSGYDLVNITGGGNLGNGWDERASKLLSEMRKGNKTWTFGIPRPDSTRKRISETKRLNPDKSIARPWLGKKRDVEHMKKMSFMSQSEESKTKRYGHRKCRKLSEEHKNAIRKSITKKPLVCSNGKKYESINDASRQLNISAGRISEVLNGVRKSAKGMQFNFDEV